MKKVTRKDINKNNMVGLGYCQCQEVLKIFGEDFKVGYNSGLYGWNYDLYNINGISVVTGYRVPYAEYSNKKIEKKLIALENKIKLKNLSFKEYVDAKKSWRREFLEIFE